MDRDQINEYPSIADAMHHRECVAVCCSVLQCAVVCCSALQCVAACCNVLQCFTVCCSVLQCVAVFCSVLQCVAVCCSALQRKYQSNADAMQSSKVAASICNIYILKYMHTAICKDCNTL